MVPLGSPGFLHHKKNLLSLILHDQDQTWDMIPVRLEDVISIIPDIWLMTPSTKILTPAALHLWTMDSNSARLPDLESSLYETGWYLVHHWEPWICSFGGETYELLFKHFYTGKYSYLDPTVSQWSKVFLTLLSNVLPRPLKQVGYNLPGTLAWGAGVPPGGVMGGHQARHQDCIHNLLQHCCDWASIQ